MTAARRLGSFMRPCLPDRPPSASPRVAIAAGLCSTARSMKQPSSPPRIEKSRWRQNVESIGLALIIALAVRSSVVQAFWVPSGSMLPTIQIGDHIFVNKLAYAVRLPLLGTEVWKVGDLQRNDIVVFVSPVDRSTD